MAHAVLAAELERRGDLAARRRALTPEQAGLEWHRRPSAGDMPESSSKHPTSRSTGSLSKAVIMRDRAVSRRGGELASDSVRLAQLRGNDGARSSESGRFVHHQRVAVSWITSSPVTSRPSRMNSDESILHRAEGLLVFLAAFTEAARREAALWHSPVGCMCAKATAAPATDGHRITVGDFDGSRSTTTTMGVSWRHARTIVWVRGHRRP